jgi:hypothetical protein
MLSPEAREIKSESIYVNMRCQVETPVTWLTNEILRPGTVGAEHPLIIGHPHGGGIDPYIEVFCFETDLLARVVNSSLELALKSVRDN